MVSELQKVIESVGSSPESVVQAIGRAVEQASAELRALRWFGRRDAGAYQVDHFQLALKTGVTLDG